ncbi:MAG: SsrA-binding protein SmpB [Desulfobacterales bacterium]|nr:SsrA-binding protein SmpB [Desulfobacterales bacterium]
MSKDYTSTIARNKKARYSYTIESEYEAGMVLVGSEVKSIRNGGVNLKDSYAEVRNGEMYIYQMNISHYAFANYGNHEPERPRKLLLHKKEILKIESKINEKGITVVPLSMYFKKGKIKLKIGLGKGKNVFDKRQTIQNREADRELHRINKFKEY